MWISVLLVYIYREFNADRYAESVSGATAHESLTCLIKFV